MSYEIAGLFIALILVPQAMVRAYFILAPDWCVKCGKPITKRHRHP